MYIRLQTYDLESAKKYFEKSGILAVGKSIKDLVDKRSFLSQPFMSPFNKMGYLLIGLKKLADPNLEKEINKTADEINDLKDELKSKKSISWTKVRKLKSLTNKFVRLAKKTGDEKAIQDAETLKEEFEREFKRSSRG